MSPLTHKERRALTVDQRRAIAKELRHEAKQALKALERAKAIAAAKQPCTCGKRYEGHKRGPTCPARKGGETWVLVPPPRKVLSTIEKIWERR